MSKSIYTPLRKAEIISLAGAMRSKYERRSIDEIAGSENIILIREPDASSKKAGYACVLTNAKPKRIKSLSRPGQFLFSFAEEEIIQYDCIVLNPLYGIPEREIFWHEFYHLWYSPSRNGKLDFYHQYSTSGALDAQEERRANTFAAFLLIPEIQDGDTPQSLSENWNVSEDLAKLRLLNIENVSLRGAL